MKLAGKPAYKRVLVKVILPSGEVERYDYKAKPSQCFTEKTVDILLEALAEKLDETHKYWDFRLVPVGGNAFNFVYAGLKEKYQAPPIASSAPLPVAVEVAVPTANRP